MDDSNNVRQLVREFLSWAKPKLGIQGPVQVRLLRDRIQGPTHKTFGTYDPNNGVIKVTYGDRHPLDVLRSLAHELVHHSQAQQGMLNHTSGDTGSDIENQANSKAGVLLRDYSRDFNI